MLGRRNSGCNVQRRMMERYWNIHWMVLQHWEAEDTLTGHMMRLEVGRG